MNTKNNVQEYLYASRGPVTTMPGDAAEAPEGVMCESHPTIPAYRRVQGETDSMGCEYFYQCRDCYDDFLILRRQKRAGHCDWCKCHKEDIREHRDFEEGLAGPLYDVCLDCIRKEAAQVAEELGDEPLDVDDHDDGPWPDDLDDNFDHLDDVAPVTKSASEMIQAWPMPPKK